MTDGKIKFRLFNLLFSNKMNIDRIGAIFNLFSVVRKNNSFATLKKVLVQYSTLWWGKPQGPILHRRFFNMENFICLQGAFVAIMDEFQDTLRVNKTRPIIFRACCCPFFYLISLPMVTNVRYSVYPYQNDFIWSTLLSAHCTKRIKTWEYIADAKSKSNYLQHTLPSRASF